MNSVDISENATKYIHRAVKIRLLPTKEQEFLFRKSAGAARWAYNYFLLAKAIAQQKFYEFKRQIRYKAEMYGIEVIEADKCFASSKTCSKCGNVKQDLKLSDRRYVCSVCGLQLDRDLNAAVNLANYKAA